MKRNLKKIGIILALSILGSLIMGFFFLIFILFLAFLGFLVSVFGHYLGDSSTSIISTIGWAGLAIFCLYLVVKALWGTAEEILRMQEKKNGE